MCTHCIAQDENDANAMYQVGSDEVYNVTVKVYSEDKDEKTIPLTSSKPLHTLCLFLACQCANVNRNTLFCCYHISIFANCLPLSNCMYAYCNVLCSHFQFPSL